MFAVRRPEAAMPSIYFAADTLYLVIKRFTAVNLLGNLW